MKILDGGSSSLTMTITALQIFGIVPHEVKKKKASENEQKMEVSQLMWIWCIVVRVLYVAALSVIVYDQIKIAFPSYFLLIMKIGPNSLYLLLPYNVLFAPLQWKSNLILHNHLLRLKHRTQALKFKSLTKSRAVFVFFCVLQFLLNILFAFEKSYNLFYIIMFIYLNTYFLILIVLQVIFFQCCCSTIEDFVPDTPSSLPDMKFYTSSIELVRKKYYV